jgi:hypothetical protein
VVSITPQPLYAREKNPRYPLDRKLGVPQNRSGLHGEEKILAPTGTRTPTPLLLLLLLIIIIIIITTTTTQESV